jgi:transcriptional regulator with XRE-family HTH domain
MKQAAEAVNRHLSAISKWEEGSVSPTARELEALAERYKVHPGLFFLDPAEFGQTRSSSHAVRSVLIGVDPFAYAMAGEDREAAEFLTSCLRVYRSTPAEYSRSWIASGMAAAGLADKLAKHESRQPI